MLTLKHLAYTYASHNKGNIAILNNCSFEFEKNGFYAITAPSGSGKSTLLNILGLLDFCQSGTYTIEGTDTAKLNDRALSALRARHFGFLFQNFRLIPNLSVHDNIKVALEIVEGRKHADHNRQADTVLEQVGLLERRSHLPSELSGGENQRVALARALVKNPQILLADEPTGNLDPDNRDHILELIKGFHKGGGTVIMVTHDHTAARRAEQIVELKNQTLSVVSQRSLAI